VQRVHMPWVVCLLRVRKGGRGVVGPGSGLVGFEFVQVFEAEFGFEFVDAGEIEGVGGGEDWDGVLGVVRGVWVPVGDLASVGEDVGGFVALEELSGRVEV
jgi:hypothetical protein